MISEAKSTALTVSWKWSVDTGTVDLPLAPEESLWSIAASVSLRLIGVLELLLALEADSERFSWRWTWSSREVDTARTRRLEAADTGTELFLEAAEVAGDTARLGPRLADLISSK